MKKSTKLQKNKFKRQILIYRPCFDATRFQVPSANEALCIACILRTVKLINCNNSWKFERNQCLARCRIHIIQKSLICFIFSLNITFLFNTVYITQKYRNPWRLWILIIKHNCGYPIASFLLTGGRQLVVLNCGVSQLPVIRHNLNALIAIISYLYIGLPDFR